MKGELPMEVSDFEDDLVGLNTRKSRLLDSIQDIDDDIKTTTPTSKKVNL